MMIIFCKFFDDRKKIVYTTSATHRDKIAYEWVQF